MTYQKNGCSMAKHFVYFVHCRESKSMFWINNSKNWCLNELKKKWASSFYISKLAECSFFAIHSPSARCYICRIFIGMRTNEPKNGIWAFNMKWQMPAEKKMMRFYWCRLAYGAHNFNAMLLLLLFLSLTLNKIKCRLISHITRFIVMLAARVWACVEFECVWVCVWQ